MMPGTVVLLGDLPVERTAFDVFVTQLGWSLQKAASFRCLEEMSDDNVVAVLFDANTLGVSWAEALKLVLDAAPSALPIVCHRFSETMEWPELAAAGAFHSLPLPLDPGEVRQSLGFAWSAKRIAPASVVPFRHPEWKRTPPVMRGRAHSAGSVA
jgi:DNA-binding NtrC family response regulator